MSITAIALLIGSAWAQFTVATMDSALDLEHPDVRPFVCAEMLGDTAYASHKILDQREIQGNAHGTLVARGLLSNLPPERVRLVPVPLDGDAQPWWKAPIVFASLGVLAALPSGYQKRLIGQSYAENYASIGRAFDAAHVRLVVISSYADGDDPVRKWTLRFRVGRAFYAAATEQLMAFMKAHPEILFVMAAGNSGRELTRDQRNGTLVAGIDNLLVVGARNMSGNIAKTSNRSAEFVDVLAPGESLGPDLGTSFAGPAVANVIASEWLEHPEWSAADAKARFLSSCVVSRADLRGVVKNGWVLPSMLNDDPAFIVKLDGPADRATFETALETEARGSLEELSPGTSMSAVWMQSYDPRRTAMLDQLLANQLGPRTRVGDRLRAWLDDGPEPKLVVPFTADGEYISAGLLVRPSEIVALDHAARVFVPALEQMLAR